MGELKKELKSINLDFFQACFKCLKKITKLYSILNMLFYINLNKRKEITKLYTKFIQGNV
jgi:hypothetical protein